MTNTILIVDDQPDNLKTIVRHIENSKSPYDLLQSINAETAFEIASKEQPDLIITDWEMPGTNGIELIKKLKQFDSTEDIPIIMCTGIMLSSFDLETALEAGAIDYIRKPIDQVELLARINSTLRLSESIKEIKRLNDSKDKIFSIISHDLQTPVGHIKNFVSWALEQIQEYDKEEVVKLLNSIYKQSSSAFHTMEKLLNWSHCMNNSFMFNPQQQLLKPVINETFDLQQGVAHEKNIILVNSTPENIEGYFDSDMISTVLRNLISNAIKFSNEKTQVRISAEKKDHDLVICITDQGIGIENEKRSTLFDPTHFETSYGTNHEKGSGLGLKICQDFIKMHNGELTVDSQPNKGSTFCISLPNNSK